MDIFKLTLEQMLMMFTLIIVGFEQICSGIYDK